MNGLSPPIALFGIPLAIKRADARQLAEALASLWQRQMRRPKGTLQEDLDELRTFFDPLATGTRLRRLLAELDAVPSVRSRWLKSPIVLESGEELLVTPEGRAALAVLEDLLESSSEDILAIDPDVVCAVEHSVYTKYREWSIRRLEDVLRLQTGKAQALPMPSIGSLLLLLVNGSRSPDTALRRLADPIEQNRLDESIGRIVAAFCDTLEAGRRDARHSSLYSGYAMTEARRRLPGGLGPERDAFYILPGSEEHVIKLIATELRRPQRSPTTAQVLTAFDNLVATYRQELRTLAALHMAHERRAQTRRFRKHLENALGGDSSSS
jgi:hypothetical protein